MDPHFRRNYQLGLWNGVSFHVAEAFIGESTVLPSFISNLTSSKVLIGLAGSLRRASWPLPQVIVAGYIEHKERKLPVYQTTAFLRIIAMIGLALATFLSRNSSTLLLFFFLTFSIYSISAGIAGLPFMEIVAKTIPSEKRGSYFGSRLFVGGVLAVVAGFFVKQLLEFFPFPQNYAALFLIATLFVSTGVIVFSFVIEPIHPVEKRKRGSSRHGWTPLLEGFRILRMDQNYRTLFLTRVLIGIGAMSFPFYILHTRQILPVPEGAVGLFLSSEMIGSTLTNLLWGNLSNRKGNKIVLQGSALASLLIPLVALALPFLQKPPLSPFVKGGILGGFYPSLLLFFLIGAVKSGVWIGYPNFLIDISPEKRRPTYIGFMNTLIAPVLFLPAAGGRIVELYSFEVLFTLSLAAASLAFFFASRLKEPRKKHLMQSGGEDVS